MTAFFFNKPGRRDAPMTSRLSAALGALALVFSLAADTAEAAAEAPSPPAVSSKWTVVGHLAADQIIVQSHRGAGVLAEENTLSAFELGWKLGTYPECDVRTTSDGVIVTFHDNDFNRVVRNLSPELHTKGVQDVTFATLSTLDVGSWRGSEFVGHHVPRLAEVFAVTRGRPERHLYLDIKNVDLRSLAALVREYGVNSQIILATPKPEVIREWKTLVPESDTLLWMRGSEEGLRQRIDSLRAAQFAGITQLQIHIFPIKELDQALKLAGATPKQIAYSPEHPFTTPGPFTLSNEFIVELGRELRSHQIVFQALPYTEDASVYAQLLDLGIASFATDHPDVTLREIKRYCEQQPSSAAPVNAR